MHLPKTLDWNFRKLSSSFRALPNCQIVGAQKAGTSSLYYYLTQHPQVHTSFKKEVHYFDGGIEENVDSFQNGINWYKAHFPFSMSMRANDICLDATPMYLFHPFAAERIYSLTPESKIIILLRNPTERAISHYFHSKRHGFENLSIEEAFAKEEHRLSNIIEKQNYKKTSFRVHSYQSRGFYLAQIKRFESLFPRENILYLDCQQLFQNPKLTLSKVHEFLGIDAFDTPNIESKNVGTNKKKVPNNVYDKLNHLYKDKNIELAKHLNLNIDW